MSQGVTVLQQFPVPRPTTNPYLVMLADHLRAVPGVTVLNFTWKTAMLGRYDVFHVHWPEILVDGGGPLKRFVRQCLTALLLLRLRVTRRPIVRTVHNVALPDGLSRVQRFILERLDRQTTMRITLNRATELAEGQAAVLIPHGHYREWFARFPAQRAIDGRIGYFGLIRRYKGVETLLESFRETAAARPELSLRVGGKPSTPELAGLMTALAGDDPRIRLDQHFLGDDELVDLATSSELVVLPYRFMHNSGSALAALSLDRPVLVPDNEANRLLDAEAGPGWVQRFEGELTAKTLLAAIDAVRASRSERTSPRFTDREWDAAAERHARAYREAIALLRHGGRPQDGERQDGKRQDGKRQDGERQDGKRQDASRRGGAARGARRGGGVPGATPHREQQEPADV